MRQQEGEKERGEEDEEGGVCTCAVCAHVCVHVCVHDECACAYICVCVYLCVCEGGSWSEGQRSNVGEAQRPHLLPLEDHPAL